MSEAGENSQGQRMLLPIAAAARTRAVFYELLGQRRGLAVAAFGALLAATAVGLATAPLLGRIVDLVVQRAGADAITTPVLLLAAVAVVQGVLMGCGTNLVAQLGERMLAALRERFVGRALGLPLEQVELAGSGDLTSRVSDDVMVIAETVRQALPAMVRAVFTIVLTLAAMAVLDWRFLLAALLAVPVQLNAVLWYTKRAGTMYAEQRVAVGAQQHQLLDTVGGARTVRAFRLGAEHTGRVRGTSQHAVDLAIRAIRMVTRFFARLNLAEFIGLSAVLVVGFLLVRADAASVGTATAAALYFHSLFNPINAALVLVDDVQSATASMSRLVGVADLPPPAEPQRPAAPKDASVRATDVRHVYRADKEVLCGVDLDISPGERVALVGASGAGKTTLAKLIAGVHTATAGQIRLGGATLTDIGPNGLRGSVVLLTQEVHVFAGTLAEDLRLARPEADTEELRAALREVRALGWAEALEDGLDTVVGAGGHRLTAAQAQQLALARVLLTDPPVIILDEATAEAGSAGARELETSAAAVLAGRSALVVAHRLTQAAAADRVVVLDLGAVVETGTHEELVAAGGHYAQLWRAWSDDHRTTRSSTVGATE